MGALIALPSLRLQGLYLALSTMAFAVLMDNMFFVDSRVFGYAGVAKEFPTAPTDSFLVANASYIARMTGSDAVGDFLVQTDGTPPRTVAARVRRVVGSAAQVTDIQTSRRVVGSNLTAVELSGLTKVELAFALILAAAASGLTLGLGLHSPPASPPAWHGA